jgi:hypothetical protein
MTKISVLNEVQEDSSIKLIKELIGGVFDDVDDDKVSDWENVTLLKKNYYDGGYDLIWAYDSGRDSGCLYLGYWNRNR